MIDSELFEIYPRLISLINTNLYFEKIQFKNKMIFYFENNGINIKKSLYGILLNSTFKNIYQPICIIDSGKYLIAKSHFENNEAKQGGALNILNTLVIIMNNQFIHNLAFEGGSIYIDSIS